MPVSSSHCLIIPSTVLPNKTQVSGTDNWKLRLWKINWHLWCRVTVLASTFFHCGYLDWLKKWWTSSLSNSLAGWLSHWHRGFRYVWYPAAMQNIGMAITAMTMPYQIIHKRWCSSWAFKVTPSTRKALSRLAQHTSAVSYTASSLGTSTSLINKINRSANGNIRMNPKMLQIKSMICSFIYLSTPSKTTFYPWI